MGAKEITGRIQAELEADLATRQKARRNVHQHFTQEQLLTVDLVMSAPGLEKARARSPVKRGWKTRRPDSSRAEEDSGKQVPPTAMAKTTDLGALGSTHLEDDGRDLDAELEAVAAEAAELEKQLAAAESAELQAATKVGLAVGTTTVDADANPAALRRGRKKRRSK